MVDHVGLVDVGEYMVHLKHIDSPWNTHIAPFVHYSITALYSELYNVISIMPIQISIITVLWY